MNYGTLDDWMLWKYMPLKCDNCDHPNVRWTTTDNAFNKFKIGKQHYNFLCNYCYQKLVVTPNLRPLTEEVLKNTNMRSIQDKQ